MKSELSSELSAAEHLASSRNASIDQLKLEGAAVAEQHKRDLDHQTELSDATIAELNHQIQQMKLNAEERQAMLQSRAQLLEESDERAMQSSQEVCLLCCCE